MFGYPVHLAAEGAALISAADLAPLTQAVTDNAGVLIPVGVGIMALLISISLIPRILYKFF